MSFTQLTSPMPVFVIGKGKGRAFAVIDYGPEDNLIWVTALDDSGEIWCAPNPTVRMRANWTLGRPVPPAEVAALAAQATFPSDDVTPASTDTRQHAATAMRFPGAEAEAATLP